MSTITANGDKTYVNQSYVESSFDTLDEAYDKQLDKETLNKPSDKTSHEAPGEATDKERDKTNVTALDKATDMTPNKVTVKALDNATVMTQADEINKEVDKITEEALDKTSNKIKTPNKATDEVFQSENAQNKMQNETFAKPRDKTQNLIREESVFSDNKPDPFQLVVIEDNHSIAWEGRSRADRVKSAVVNFLKTCLLFVQLYFFICSLDLLSNAFRLLGGRAANEAFRHNQILSNPIADLMLGVMATVLLQSSSTTTSIVVSMVAANLLPIRAAIFIIMGTNIGTSVTNTLVSMGQALERDQFRRAFAGATVHDMFNWLTVLVLLPIEWISGIPFEGCGMMCKLTGIMTNSLDISESSNTKHPDLLKTITRPLTDLVIQIDKSVLTNIDMNMTTSNVSLIKHWCSAEKDEVMPLINNNSVMDIGKDSKIRCVFLFEHISNSWPDAAIGGCLMLIAISLLIGCLVTMVKVLNTMLRGSVARLIQRLLNSDFPGHAACLTGYAAILVGAVMTVILQSSSVFTSTLTPLVGIGVLHVDRMYPLTLGSNIGTTVTAMLASLTADIDILHKTLQVALCHLFFNILGILIWYPIPAFRRVPINMAKQLGLATANHRWMALAYLVCMFLLLPTAIFGLTMAGWIATVCVLSPVVILVTFFVLVNVMQKRCTRLLPKCLRTWDRLPIGCRSLTYYETLPGCRRGNRGRTDTILSMRSDRGRSNTILSIRSDIEHVTAGDPHIGLTNSAFVADEKLENIKNPTMMHVI